MRQIENHVVSEVVEAELVIGAVSYVRLVSLAAGDRAEKSPPLVLRLIVAVVDIRRGRLAGCLLGIDGCHAYAQGAVNRAHPMAVPSGKVIIDGDQMAASPGKGIEIER